MPYSLTRELNEEDTTAVCDQEEVLPDRQDEEDEEEVETRVIDPKTTAKAVNLGSRPGFMLEVFVLFLYPACGWEETRCRLPSGVHQQPPDGSNTCWATSGSHKVAVITTLDLKLSLFSTVPHRKT